MITCLNNFMLNYIQLLHISVFYNTDLDIILSYDFLAKESKQNNFKLCRFNSRDKNGIFRELMVELLMNCQLNSTLVFLNNTKWVAGKSPQKKKNSFHSLSRSVFLRDPKIFFSQGPEDIF